jgi:aldehyde:ferredoxin oxidoreductase
MNKIIGRVFTTPYEAEKRLKKNSINGRILRVDLSSGKLWIEQPGEQFYRKYIGGRGVILYYLLKELTPKIDPFSSENLLIFASGVLTGTIPGGGRHAVGCKSPLTGALASGEAGGWWGVELKRAGFDAIVIQGKALQPVYLWIKDGTVEIRDAAHLWGKPTADTEEAIRNELGDEKIRVAQIGPGGENLVRFACIVHDRSRAAGRSGAGAVMGSKNLKAIALRGSSALGVADRQVIAPVVRWINSNYKTLMEWAVVGGTPGDVKHQHDLGSLPINNFRDDHFENVEKLDAESYFPLILKGRDTCYGCPVRCKTVLERTDPDGRNIDPRYGGPEYETIGALGSMCMVDDPIAVAMAAQLCEANSLDTISTGATISFTMECVEKGIIKSGQGYDFLPSFGDGNSLVRSVELIASRQGIGSLMAEGSQRMANKLGDTTDGMVNTVRGQEIPMHDPRLKNTFGLGYALSPTGADHMHNMDDTFANDGGSDVSARLEELGFSVPMPLFGLSEEKVHAYVYEIAFKNFMDSAVICQFFPYEYHHMVDAVRGASGWDYSREELIDSGLRIANMARLFLMREGFTAQDDNLPQRMFQAHKTGPTSGKALTPEEFKSALHCYYKLMDWTEKGEPKLSVIKKMGIEEFWS